MTAPILTVTLNPALDVSTRTARLESQLKLRCEKPAVAPGGGGANVSRMIARLGGESHAFVALGGPTGARWRRLAEAEGLALLMAEAPGDTRESFQVAIDGTGDFYRFLLPGPDWAEADGLRLEEALLAHLRGGRYRLLVLSGSLAPGLDPALPARLAEAASELGIATIADCAGPPLVALLKAPLRVLRLNRRDLAEAARALGCEGDPPDDVARAILAGGRIETVLYSLGEAGTAAVGRGACYRFVPPRVPVRSLTGAGDSLTGALAFALARGEDMTEAVRLGVAAAAATAMQPGSNLADPVDIERLLPRIDVDQSPLR
ncbi:MAG: 1-phosphofructokinase family hexose kinase [Rhodothalassiaceae bacterium]